MDPNPMVVFRGANFNYVFLGGTAMLFAFIAIMREGGLW